jgi:hypothetical protein
MRKDAVIFLVILILNAVVTFLYWLFFRIFRKKEEAGFAARCLVMLLCPIVGPTYFILGWLLRKIFFHKPVDLTDVIFSKEREEILLKADEDGESNLAPVDDAVTVFDTENARALMLRVLRTDIRRSLGSISRGLESGDSEIAHYAASMLQAELGKFRSGVQQAEEEIDRIEEELQAAEAQEGALKTAAGEAFSAHLAGKAEQPEDDSGFAESDLEKAQAKEERHTLFADLSDKLEDSEDYDRHEASAHEQGLRAFYGDEDQERTVRQKLQSQADTARELIWDIHEVLNQKVLSDMESARMAALADRMALLLLKRDTLTEGEMAAVAQCHLLLGDHGRCGEWCERLEHVYPGSLEAFSAKLKLLYGMGRREEFLDTLERMKQTGVPLDHEMLELVRFFM